MNTANAVSAAAEPFQCRGELHGDFIPVKTLVERRAKFVCRRLPATEARRSRGRGSRCRLCLVCKVESPRQRPVRDFPSRMAFYGVLNACDARHTSTKDVLSRRAQKMHGFAVDSLNTYNRRSIEESQARSGRSCHFDAVAEQLYENRRTPPGDQAAFRVDYAAWLTTRSQSDRELILALATGEKTADLALKHRVTPGRISQKRREFHDSWERFHGEQPAKTGAAVA